MEQKETPQADMPAKKSGDSNKTKNPMMQFFAGLLVVIIVVVLGVYVYTKSQVKDLSTSSFVMQAADALRVPVAKINGTPILYTEFITDLLSLQRFYTNQPEGYPVPGEEDVAEQVLSRLFINQLVIDLADKYDTVIEEDDMATAKAELLSQFPDEDSAAQEINNTFGWSLETFTDRVISPIVLEQKVAEAFTADESIDDIYKTMQVKGSHILFTAEEGKEDAVKEDVQGVLDRIKNGENFAELAKEFGSDGTSEAGGELGWIDKGTTVPSFEEVLFSLEAGELYGEVVETEFGFHIIRADDVRTTNNFSLFFKDLLSEAKIKMYTELANPFDEEEVEEIDELSVELDLDEEGVVEEEDEE
jgi:parvulin-like peptidyl-prolyl isomerase